LPGLTRLAPTELGGAGLVGIIIGFAFRDIAENFFASLLLSVRNLLRGGDLIKVAGQTGIVQNLNTLNTVLLTLDGNHVQIPKCRRLQEHHQELQQHCKPPRQIRGRHHLRFFGHEGATVDR